MVREAPCGKDRTAAGDDAGDPLRGERHVAQEHAGVDGEVVDTLLRLLDDGFAVDVPGELVRVAADLLERLVDRDSSDRNWRVADDPLAGRVDVLARREIHDRVGAPARRPAHLLDLVVDARQHRGVADVGVHLHEELGADDHRLGFGVIDVRRDDGAAARDLIAHQLRCEALANGDELHLRRHHALAGVVELGHGGSEARAQRGAARRGGRLDIASLDDPRRAQRRQPGLGRDGDVGIPVGTTRVVQAQGGVRRVPAGAAGRCLRDLAEGHAQVLREPST